jgi:PhnB protein
MSTTPYLFFNGDCEAAFTRYQQVLGGTITAMMRYRGSPAEAGTPPEWHDKIMHACLELDGRQVMAGDAPPGHYQAPQGFAVHVAVPNVAEAERVFCALVEGGQTRMPLAPTFWATSFGMLVDRWGIPWMVHCAPAEH